MNIPNSSTRNRSSITSTNSSQPVPGAGSASGANALRPANPAGGGSDRVSLSKFSAALAASDSNSPQQLARLAGINAASANGSYQINAPAVSESIVNGHFRT
jgi:hypothetical protein